MLWLLTPCIAWQSAIAVDPSVEASVWELARQRMVVEQIEARGVESVSVLTAMVAVERHRFVPESMEALAYSDRPLPIGEEQTISQPYIVALMTELSGAGPGSKVLEVGTGSGYQAAVLAAVGAEVYSIEILAGVAKLGRDALEAAGFSRVHTRIGDGYRGWPEAAPFDAIVVTAAPGHVPQPLLEQLAVGGRMVIPVGERTQQLMVLERTTQGIEQRVVIPVLFVPMTGEAETIRR